MYEDPCKRLQYYIKCFEESTKDLKILSVEARRIVDLAQSYLKDSKYYLEKGDCITGLVTISYAEGLLDALRELELIEFSWRRRKEPKKVLVAGSFDVLHPGHIYFLKQASTYGDKLYVIIARDDTYRRIRGMDPVFNENERLQLVSAIRYVYKALLGSLHDILEPVREVRPDVVVLGPDQKPDQKVLDTIINELKAQIIRLDERLGAYSSSGIKERIARMYRNRCRQ